MKHHQERVLDGVGRPEKWQLDHIELYDALYYLLEAIDPGGGQGEDPEPYYPIPYIFGDGEAAVIVEDFRKGKINIVRIPIYKRKWWQFWK